MLQKFSFLIHLAGIQYSAFRYTILHSTIHICPFSFVCWLITLTVLKRKSETGIKGRTKFFLQAWIGNNCVKSE